MRAGVENSTAGVDAVLCPHEPRVRLTSWVSAADVQRALGCARSTAFMYLRQAAGRPPGERGLLRVPVETWEAYAKEMIGCPKTGSSSGVASGTAGTTRRTGSASSAVPN